MQFRMALNIVNVFMAYFLLHRSQLAVARHTEATLKPYAMIPVALTAIFSNVFLYLSFVLLYASTIVHSKAFKRLGTMVHVSR